MSLYANDYFVQLEALIQEHGLSVECSSALHLLFRQISHRPASHSAVLQSVYENQIELSTIDDTFHSEFPESEVDVTENTEKLTLLGSSRLGRYENLGQLGKGGMGEVYLVRDPDMNRLVAIKILHRHLLDDRVSLGRFIEEGQITAQLGHPNIIPIYELGQLPDGRPYFTMQVIHGRTFSKIIQEVHQQSHTGRWTETDDGWNLQRMIEVFSLACEAIGYAHSRGVIHRDLKPSNIMIGAHGESLVVDWGIAKAIHRPDVADPLLTERMKKDDTLTEAGSVEGTPAYMSPEQANGGFDQMDIRSDVYSLGAILYEILGGVRPYGNQSPFTVLRLVIDGPPPSLTEKPSESLWSYARNREGLPLPMELIAICEKAMSRNPSFRYNNGSEMAIDLHKWLDGSEREVRGLRTVRKAHSLSRDIRTLKQRLAGFQVNAEQLLQNVEPWEPEEKKLPMWELQEKIENIERRLRMKSIEQEQLLKGALTQKPDLIEAHAALAKLYRRKHMRAESEQDTEAALYAEFQLRYHTAELPLTHPDIQDHVAYLKGRGAISVITEPKATEVVLEKYLLKNYRLINASIRSLGESSLQKYPLDMGSYCIRFRHPDCADVLYPVVIERRRHWNGFAPGASGPYPLKLPKISELGDSNCYVPASWFWCGGESTSPNALPRRRMWAKEFVIQQYPVRNREYLYFLNDLAQRGLEHQALRWMPKSGFVRQNKHFQLLPSVSPDHPVNMIDWLCACAYAQWLGLRERKPWRLPFEWEWEKAARGVDGRAYPWGSNFDASWCCMRDSFVGQPLLSTVDSYPVDCSPYGVRGMGGNIRQWTASIWRANGPRTGMRQFLEAYPEVKPELRLTVKGGSWQGNDRHCLSSSRLSMDYSQYSLEVGFRLVHSFTDFDPTWLDKVLE